jgi:regulator of protease activity HflC (stomatin/prohibitin superfamily)
MSLFQQPVANEPPPSDPVGGAVGSAFRFLLIATVVLTLGWLASGTRLVQPGDQAVVRRFGAIDRVAPPGLLLAWPAPLETVELVPGPGRQLKLESNALDLLARGGANPLPMALDPDPRIDGGYALSGDAGAVHLRGTLVYTVDDPRAYATQGAALEPALRRAFQSALIAVSAARSLDHILVASPTLDDAQRTEAEAAGRERLRLDLLRHLNDRLAALRAAGRPLGIAPGRVDLAAYLLEAARPAFDAVITAEGEAAKQIAEARTAAEKSAQEAKAAAQSIVTLAQGAAAEQVAAAGVATDRVRAVMGEADPVQRQVLLTRLYRERLDAVIGRAGTTTLIGGDDARIAAPGR